MKLFRRISIFFLTVIMPAVLLTACGNVSGGTSAGNNQKLDDEIAKYQEQNAEAITALGNSLSEAAGVAAPERVELSLESVDTDWFAKAPSFDALLEDSAGAICILTLYKGNGGCYCEDEIRAILQEADSRQIWIDFAFDNSIGTTYRLSENHVTLDRTTAMDSGDMHTMTDFELYPKDMSEDILKIYEELAVYSKESENEGAIRDYLMQQFTDAGLAPNEDGNGNVICEVPKTDDYLYDTDPIIIQGHTDMAKAYMLCMAKGYMGHPALRIIITSDDEGELSGVKSLASSYFANAKYLINLDAESMDTAPVSTYSEPNIADNFELPRGLYLRDSFLFDVARQEARSMFGIELERQAVDEELECGILHESYPELDILSIGEMAADEVAARDNLRKFTMLLERILETPFF